MKTPRTKTKQNKQKQNKMAVVKRRTVFLFLFCGSIFLIIITFRAAFVSFRRSFFLVAAVAATANNGGIRPGR